MDSDQEEFQLSMPFVACASNGGQYDDESFVAGARWAQTDAILTTNIPYYEVWAEAALVAQLDLTAMYRGYRFDSEPWTDHPEWVLCKFERDTPL